MPDYPAVAPRKTQPQKKKVLNTIESFVRVDTVCPRAQVAAQLAELFGKGGKDTVEARASSKGEKLRQSRQLQRSEEEEKKEVTMPREFAPLLPGYQVLGPEANSPYVRGCDDTPGYPAPKHTPEAADATLLGLRERIEAILGHEFPTEEAHELAQFFFTSAGKKTCPYKLEEHHLLLLARLVRT